MSSSRRETTPQAVRRHLRNGFVILTERGTVALFGAAMKEVAKLVDSPAGPFLDLRHILSDGPTLWRSEGWRVATGAVFRQLGAQYDPPLGRSRNAVNDPAREAEIRYHATYELTKPDGVVPARRPANDVDFALEAPFAFDPEVEATGPVAAVVHAFYPEELEALLVGLRRVPLPVDLFVSTDTAEKRERLAAATEGWSKGSVEIRVFPNRGRDIAPKIVGFRDVYERYDLFVHLHTKKSPHGGAPLARWRDYLVANLLGSTETIRSILHLFNDPKVGIVFAQHLFEIRGILNWGYDYEHARRLMRRLGTDIDKDLALEFPSGSMFWGRSAAIRNLLDAGLDFEDFPAESGQVDGTLAHAIERIILMVAESNGFEWRKVVKTGLYPLSKTVLPVMAATDLEGLRLKVFQPCLVPVNDEAPPFERTLAEIRPLTPYPSRNPRPRLNILVPTVNPQQAFGGVTTAIRLFMDWAGKLGPEYDRRIIVTDAEIEPDGYAWLADYTPTPFVAGLDGARATLIDAKDRNGRLDLREREVFVATAWWTAEFARALETHRRRFAGDPPRPFVYLIQDDEPNFYGWGSKWARAEATYRDGDQIVAVVNSEELYAHMMGRYRFREAFCLPYELNSRLAERLASRPRERTILVYGRYTVSRNAFEAICEALRRWQQRDPIRASRWRILFLGETFETALLYPLQNAEVQGKVSLDLYAEHLSRAAIGISLMISPHPSYPPLEMAQAGLETIANSFVGKDLRRRFPDIVSLDAVEPDSLSQAIERAVDRREPTIGAPTSQQAPSALDIPGRAYDPDAMVEILRAALEGQHRPG